MNQPTQLTNQPTNKANNNPTNQANQPTNSSRFIAGLVGRGSWRAVWSGASVGLAACAIGLSVRLSLQSLLRFLHLHCYVSTFAKSAPINQEPNQSPDDDDGGDSMAIQLEILAMWSETNQRIN